MSVWPKLELAWNLSLLVGISAIRYAAKNAVATFENSFAWSLRSLLRPMTAAYFPSYQYRRIKILLQPLIRTLSATLSIKFMR